MRIKKYSLFTFILLIFFMVGTLPATASTQLTVSIPSFPVSLNGITIDSNQNQYPILQYNNITYIPLTYYNSQLLGLNCVFSKENGLTITTSNYIYEQSIAQKQYQSYHSSTSNLSSYVVSHPNFIISVNGKKVQNINREYPFFIFRDIIYLPLTWEYIVKEFDWLYSFDIQNGLSIAPKPSLLVLDDSFTTQDEKDNITTTIHYPSNSPVYVIGDIVNIRSGAGTDYSILEQVSYNDELIIHESQLNNENELWYKVQTKSSQIGWIASWLISDAANKNNLKSTGELTTIELLGPFSEDKATVFAIKNGEGNDYAIQNVSTTSIRIILDNVITNSELQTRFNNSSISISSNLFSNNRLSITVNYALGDYVDIKQNGDWLYFYCYKTHMQLQGSTIVLDPGHGGADVGAQGITMKNLTDADIGYSVVLRLKRLLENEGAHVFLTRANLSPNEKISVEERTAISNNIQPDLFISIHANSTEKITNATGAETYVYNGNIYSQQILSENLAKHICSGLAEITGQKSVIKKQNFYVLRENNHPSVLIETGYLSNPSDELLLSTKEYQQQLAEGIYLGLQNYFKQF